jgi:hypothetical protein
MATKTTKRLQEICTKAAAANHWPLAAAAQAVLGDESSLDHQINFVGAMHEVGSLRNRLEPFWQLWRNDPTAWATRCVERLASADRDYWAVAALLGMDILQVWPVFKKAGYNILSLRAIPPVVKALTHYGVFSIPKYSGDLWAPVFEIGWDAKNGEITDSGRWRAISFDTLTKKDGSFIGKGSGSNFIRAALPHGSWRVESADFVLVKEAVIPVEKTLLNNA